MNSRDFIKLLDDYEFNVFDARVIEEQTGYAFNEWQYPLRSLTRNGLVVKLENGKYARHNFADEKVIGSFVSNGGAISHWTALSYYGLTTQISNTVFVSSPYKKRDGQILGVSYKFILIKQDQYFGILQEGVGNNSYYITDMEKTLIDCLLRPEYAGEYSELLFAIGNVKINLSRLIQYCKTIKNGALNKRLGYLLEVSNPEQNKKFISFAQKNKTTGYNLLDPFGEKDGNFSAKWNLCINIDESALHTLLKEKNY